MQKWIYEKDVEITMSDGVVLRANIFRPNTGESCPAILTVGPYGKDVAYHNFRQSSYFWRRLLEKVPEVVENSSGKWMNWEVADPEQWVPHGYAVIRVDSRGQGKSEGVTHLWSERYTLDYAEVIDWVGSRYWCSGKVGLLGTSWYAATQWQVAAQNPKHLAAIAVWEGFCDFYRSGFSPGGIIKAQFLKDYFREQIISLQHGNSNTPFVDMDDPTSLPTGPEQFTEEELAKNRVNFDEEVMAHPLRTKWYDELDADLSKITVPLLASGNWTTVGSHLNGAIDGYYGVSSKNKWLHLHGGEHWQLFHADEGRAMQRAFFDCYLKGIDNGWKSRPSVVVNTRYVSGEEKERASEAFPLPGTEYRKFFLDSNGGKMSNSIPSKGSVQYEGFKEGVKFTSDPFESDTEMTGYVKLELYVASSTNDMDVIASLRVIDKDGKQITFPGYDVITRGWLRCTLRKLDGKKTTDYRPWHTFDEPLPLKPDAPNKIEVSLEPTSIVIPAGAVIELTLAGIEFMFDVARGGFFAMDSKGNPHKREEIYNGTNTVFSGDTQASYLQIPIINN